MKTRDLTSKAEPSWMALFALISVALLLDAFVFDFAMTTWLKGLW